MGAGSSAVRRRWRSRFKLPAPLPARSGGAGSQPDRQGASGACCPCLAGRAPRECRAPPRMVPGAAVATVTRERVTAAELPTFRGSAALGQGRPATHDCLLFKLAPLAAVLVWQWMHSNLVEPETPAPRCCYCGAGRAGLTAHWRLYCGRVPPRPSTGQPRAGVLRDTALSTPPCLYPLPTHEPAANARTAGAVRGVSAVGRTASDSVAKSAADRRRVLAPFGTQRPSYTS
jgi:hypothetical protein